MKLKHLRKDTEVEGSIPYWDNTAEKYAVSANLTWNNTTKVLKSIGTTDAQIIVSRDDITPGNGSIIGFNKKNSLNVDTRFAQISGIGQSDTEGRFYVNILGGGSQNFAISPNNATIGTNASGYLNGAFSILSSYNTAGNNHLVLKNSDSNFPLWIEANGNTYFGYNGVAGGIGKVGIGTTYGGNTGRLTVVGTGFGGATKILDLFSSTPTSVFTVYDDGSIFGNVIKIQNTSPYNISLGYRSGYSLTTGFENVMLGYEAGYSSTAASNNVFIGKWSGYYSKTDSENIGIGYNSCKGNSTSGMTGYRNIGIGSNSLTNITSGLYNIALGSQALEVVNTGEYNLGIGYQAGYSTTAGSYGVYIGYQAAYYNNSGYNIAIGKEALRGHSVNKITGTYNIGLGEQTGINLSTGIGNILIGYRSGFLVSTANYNVSLGYEAGYNLTTGSYNIFIGYQSGYNETGSNKLYISNSNTSSPLIYGEFDNNLLRVNGYLDVTSGFKANGVAGVSGTWTTVDGKTITATNGIITSIV